MDWKFDLYPLTLQSHSRRKKAHAMTNGTRENQNLEQIDCNLHFFKLNDAVMEYSFSHSQCCFAWIWNLNSQTLAKKKKS